MAEERIQRRLAAILAADVVGYSRLVEADEAGTVARLKALQTDLIHPMITQDGGRVVKVMGDGVLVEFGSAVDAVRNALAIQAEIARRNANVVEGDQIVFRVGVNLGDVIIDGDDIQGDGVNVAARLESLCEPGSVYVSATVRDHVEGKLAAAFDDLGEHTLKNISKPIRVYRVSDGSIETAMASNMPTGVLSLPDRPSIAVLPFENMSGDPDQEFFADGITEDIITELSRFENLFVIARNSTFTYKGRAVKVQEIGRELAVANIVEGSVRKAGNRIRLTAQLIDAASGNHIWADRYDRELTDLFDVQDEIVEAIVGVIPGRIEAAFAGRLKRKPPGDMAAYDCLLSAKAALLRATREDNAEAQRLLYRAIELEPDYPAAWAWKACIQAQAFYMGFSDDPEAIHQEALVAIETAYRLDENDVTCNRLMCEVRMKALRLPEAQRHHERAFEFNPNDVQIVSQRGELMTWLGQHEDAIAWIEKAMRLDPFAAQRRAHLLGQALHAARRYDEALAAFDQVSSPRWFLDVSSGIEKISDWSSDQIDHGDEGGGISVTSCSCASGLKQAVEALHASVAVG
jgi:adenylate cyclase